MGRSAIFVRKGDGACFKASYARPDEYAEHGHPMQSVLDRDHSGYFFRRVERRSFLGLSRWVETGEIWRPQEGEFERLAHS